MDLVVCLTPATGFARFCMFHLFQYFELFGESMVALMTLDSPHHGAIRDVGQLKQLLCNPQHNGFRMPGADSILRPQTNRIAATKPVLTVGFRVWWIS